MSLPGALAGPPAVLVMRGVHKAFGAVEVLAGLDVHVDAGEVVALLGVNGAGKTTAVRILSTLLRPDRGQVSVAGHDVLTAPAGVRRSISLTGQFAALDMDATGRENLSLVARLRREPDPNTVVQQLLDQFGLSTAADRKAAAYSGGMRRRLDIAMGLLGRPELLVLDEPTTGPDPQSRAQVWAVVDDLARQGMAVLLTTQYLEEAERLADRIVILHEGRIIADGTLDHLRGLLPPAHREYVEKQPSLEEIFLAITNIRGTGDGRSSEQEQ